MADEYWRGLEYNSFGSVTLEKFGNGAWTEYSYDTRNRKTSEWTLDSQQNLIRHWEYYFDERDNLLRRSDYSQKWNSTEEFTYDSLDRLTHAKYYSNDEFRGKFEHSSDKWKYDSIGMHTRPCTFSMD